MGNDILKMSFSGSSTIVNNLLVALCFTADLAFCEITFSSFVLQFSIWQLSISTGSSLPASSTSSDHGSLFLFNATSQADIDTFSCASFFAVWNDGSWEARYVAFEFSISGTTSRYSRVERFIFVERRPFLNEILRDRLRLYGYAFRSRDHCKTTVSWWCSRCMDVKYVEFQRTYRALGVVPLYLYYQTTFCIIPWLRRSTSKLVLRSCRLQTTNQ